MTYKLHERLVAPARNKSDILRLIFGLVTITSLYMMMVMLGGHVVSVIMGDAWAQAIVNSPGLTSPGQMLTVLGSFGFMIIAVCLVVILLHHRSPMTLLGGFRLATTQFFKAMRNLLPYMALMVTLAFVTEDLQPNLMLELWLSLLPLTLLFLLVQVSAEELVFRGYLQSQLAALGLHKSIWILLPAVLFGLLHYDPIIMGRAAPWFVLWAICFGVLAADLTARSGTLGPAVAFHFTINFLSVGIIGIADYLGGLNLYSYSFSITDTVNLISYLPLDTIGMLLAYLSVRLALRR
jgi:membrane protease YdiL (CAAX protease family)